MGVAWRFRRAAFWRGAGLARLPWPGRRAARCNPSDPPALPERTPLSAEPAKVTSALTNSINKTVRQGGHYLLIRDDGAGRSRPGGCCDSPTSGGQSRPKRARGLGTEPAARLLHPAGGEGALCRDCPAPHHRQPVVPALWPLCLGFLAARAAGAGTRLPVWQRGQGSPVLRSSPRISEAPLPRCRPLGWVLLGSSSGLREAVQGPSFTQAGQGRTSSGVTSPGCYKPPFQRGKCAVSEGCRPARVTQGQPGAQSACSGHWRGLPVFLGSEKGRGVTLRPPTLRWAGTDHPVPHPPHRVPQATPVVELAEPQASSRSWPPPEWPWRWR